MFHTRVAWSMTALLVGALLVNGCATNGVKRRTGRPEAFAAAFDIATGRQLWTTSIRPPISGLDSAAMEGDQLVVDGSPPMRSCLGNSLEIAFDSATGAEVRRGRPRKFVEIGYPLTGPGIAHDDSTWYSVELQAGHPVLRAVELAAHLRWEASLPDPHHQFLHHGSYVAGLISHGTLYVIGSSDPNEVDFTDCGGD